MSTRANVHVTQEGLQWEETIQLYHHCDGYPSNMLPLMAGAIGVFVDREAKRDFPIASNWELGRAGKLAAYIIATDPGGFEPESDTKLHGDIEYFYRIITVNSKGGSMAEAPLIFVEVYATPKLEPDWKRFWDTGDVSLLCLIQPRILLETAAKMAKDIQNA